MGRSCNTLRCKPIPARTLQLEGFSHADVLGSDSLGPGGSRGPPRPFSHPLFGGEQPPAIASSHFSDVPLGLNERRVVSVEFGVHSIHGIPCKPGLHCRGKNAFADFSQGLAIGHPALFQPSKVVPLNDEPLPDPNQRVGSRVQKRCNHGRIPPLLGDGLT